MGVGGGAPQDRPKEKEKKYTTFPPPPPMQHLDVITKASAESNRAIQHLISLLVA